jgi:serine protease Do
MGVQIDQVSKEVAESIGLGKSMGALVRSVEAGSPAEKGGIEAGDIITKFDGRSIEKSSDLPRLVGATKPGTRSTVTVFRRGATRDISVVVAELEADKAVAAKAPAKEEKPKASVAAQSFGLVVAEVSEAQKKELGIKGGVRVEAANDAAARGGLREGDVILQVGNVDVSSVKEFDAVVGKFDKSKGMSVLFRRAEWTQYAVLKASK